MADDFGEAQPTFPGADVLAGALFPVFAPAGFEVVLGGWGGGGGEPVRSISLDRRGGDGRSITVNSERTHEEFDPAHARFLAGERMWSSRGDTQSALGSMRVDGVEVRCAIETGGDRWVAVGIFGDVRFVVDAQGVTFGDVELRSLADPSQFRNHQVPEYRALRGGRDVLDPARITELANETAIKNLGATLAGFARGGVALLVSEEPGPNWIGGEPWLPPVSAWPQGQHGAMAFVAQLALATLDASVWNGPASGHLHVFCDIDPEYTGVEGAGACAILHTPAGAELSPREFPSGLHEYNRVPHCFVEPRIGLTLPDVSTSLMQPLGFGYGGRGRVDIAHLWTLQARLRGEQGWHRRGGLILGWPSWQNDDNTDYLASLRGDQDDEWVLLLQTDALGPELYVMLSADDLAAGRFDRAEATVEHD